MTLRSAAAGAYGPRTPSICPRIPTLSDRCDGSICQKTKVRAQRYALLSSLPGWPAPSFSGVPDTRKLPASIIQINASTLFRTGSRRRIRQMALRILLAQASGVSLSTSRLNKRKRRAKPYGSTLLPLLSLLRLDQKLILTPPFTLCSCQFDEPACRS